MTHFEYVSVAMALLLSFVVGRLLTGVAPAIRPERAYWVHLCWLAQSFLAVLSIWWGFWGARGTEWTSIRFVWVLLLPSLMFVRASILVGGDPAAVESFRDHFYENRVRFFTCSILTSVCSLLAPWVNGSEWAVVVSLARFGSVTLTLNIVGVLFARPRIQSGVAVISLLLNLAYLFLLPTERGIG